MVRVARPCATLSSRPRDRVETGNCFRSQLPWEVIVMRRLIVLAVALGLCLSAWAQNAKNSEQAKQSKCKVRFVVYQLNPHIPGGIGPGMSKEQGNWYNKNKDKYPAVCVDTEKPDYFVLWSSRFSSEGTPEPVINFGALNGSAGNTAVSASGYAVSSPTESEYVYLSVFRAADVQHAQQDSSYHPVPVYYTQHDSWWTYRKSHHKSMEDALKFLTEESKKLKAL